VEQCAWAKSYGRIGTDPSTLTGWLGAFRNPSLTFGALIGAANVRERSSSDARFLAVIVLAAYSPDPKCLRERAEMRRGQNDPRPYTKVFRGPSTGHTEQVDLRRCPKPCVGGRGMSLVVDPLLRNPSIAFPRCRPSRLPRLQKVLGGRSSLCRQDHAAACLLRAIVLEQCSRRPAPAGATRPIIPSSSENQCGVDNAS
jgi:hypothetical protein